MNSFSFAAPAMVGAMLSFGAASANAAPASAAAASAATADSAPDDPAGEWRMQARDYANTRYSTLAEINRGDVQRLRIAWTFSDGAQYGHEGAPLVVGSVMYVVAPFPDVAYALDLSKPGAPIKWQFAPEPSPLAIGKACCDAVIRGWAFADGKLIYNLLDDHTVAVDATSGKQVWRTKMGNVENGETMTMSPFVVGDKVFVGNSGGELGKIGWLAALDVATGREVWRAYSAGSDQLVKIGADFKPYYAWMRGTDLGVSSWPADMWKTAGGAAWGWISYDPQLHLLYYGTANPSPRVPVQRPGLNLWTSAVFARDPDTGAAKWAYSFTPHDQWDYDGVNENVLLDLTIGGRLRKVLVQFNRNAYAYTIDRETGEVLVAAPFAYQNWSNGIDLKSGMPMVRADKEPKPNVKLEVCPPDIGGKDWQPSAFSPKTGLLYAGIFNICMELTDHRQSYIPGTPYDGMETVRKAGPGDHWGEFMAWDPAAGKKVWAIEEKFMTMSGALATAGDLVFYGTVDGWFRAVDDRTGKVLWSQKLGSGIVAAPMTYLGPDGRQYVAVYAGVGGVATLSKAMPAFPGHGSTLYVFSIDGNSLATDVEMPTTAAARLARPEDGVRAAR